MPPLTVYKGSKKELVLAFDVGTTYSGISYCILEPGEVPQVKGVAKFPAQEFFPESSKIPSVIYYDRDGAVRAIGAETLCDGIYEKAQEEAWIKVEWFKLQFFSSNIVSPNGSVNAFMSPLPPEKSAVDVLADYYKYLLSCSRASIESSTSDGKSLWKSLRVNGIHFVLPHPNGWDTTQQLLMLKAAFKAKLVKDDPSVHSRLSFVTEGEASLHYVISRGLPLGAVSENSGVIIVDAGGGTIDMSAYKQDNNFLNVQYEEISNRRCCLEGSMFVSRRFETFLHNRLQGSKFADDISHIAACFDKHTKLCFKQQAEPRYIRFGVARDNDENHGIRFGQLKVSGDDIAACFEPAINRIVNDAEEIIKAAPANIKIERVILVGGFAASDWLYRCVSKALFLYGVLVTRPQSHVSKAVSDGAISFHISNRIEQQVVGITYGAKVAIRYDRFSTNREQRRHLVEFWPDGTPYLFAFSKILPKGTLLGSKEYRHESEKLVVRLEDLTECTLELFLFKGEVRFYEPPAQYAWMDEEENTAMFSQLCTIKANVRHIQGTTSVKKAFGSLGWYYQLDYAFVLMFSDIEIKAQFAWIEDGTEKRRDADIVYYDAEN